MKRPESVPLSMAVPPPPSSRLCEICHDPVPKFDEDSHLRTAHPDIVAVRKGAGLWYMTVYLPLSVLAAIFVVISGILQAWWWRIGILAGIYAICGLHFLSLVQEWRAEKSLRLQVVIPCAVCGERVMSAVLQDHIRAVHPAISRVATRTPWIVWPGGAVPVGYIMALVGVAILGFFDQMLWDLFPVLAFVPLVAYLVTLVVVPLVLDRRYLRPAQRQWQAAHPRTPR